MLAYFLDLLLNLFHVLPKAIHFGYDKQIAYMFVLVVSLLYKHELDLRVVQNRQFLEIGLSL